MRHCRRAVVSSIQSGARGLFLLLPSPFTLVVHGGPAIDRENVSVPVKKNPRFGRCLPTDNCPRATVLAHLISPNYPFKSATGIHVLPSLVHK